MGDTIALNEGREEREAFQEWFASTGLSYKAFAESMGRDPRTVKKYIKNPGAMSLSYYQDLRAVCDNCGIPEPPDISQFFLTPPSLEDQKAEVAKQAKDLFEGFSPREALILFDLFTEYFVPLVRETARNADMLLGSQNEHRIQE